MSKIDNSQNITIKNSRKVKLGNITNQASGSFSSEKINVEIDVLFNTLQERVDALADGPDKNVAQNCIDGLREEANKGEDAQEGSVSKWLNFLLEISPDIWAVAVDSFTNPIKGLGTAFQKVAERVRNESKTKNS